MKRLILALVAAAGTFAFASSGLCEEAKPEAKQEAKQEAKKGPPKVGDIMTSIELTDLEGKAVTVKLDGDPSAVVFFNSACSACRAEMALLEKLMRREKGLKVFAVCTDVSGADGVKRFTEMTKMDKFTYFIDPDLKAAGKFGFAYTPATVMANKEGKLYLIKGGFTNADEPGLIEKVTKKE